MPNADQEGPVTLSIVSCQACDSLFLESPRRHTCPTCGGDAGITFFTFEADDRGVRPQGVGVAISPSAQPEREPAPAAPQEDKEPVGAAADRRPSPTPDKRPSPAGSQARSGGRPQKDTQGG